MEPRIQFADPPSDLGTVYALAAADYQSADATLGIPTGPTTVAAGTDLTVTLSSPLAVSLFCSSAGSTAVLDGMPVATTPLSTAGTYDFTNGVPVPASGAYIEVAAGTHTVQFYIRAEALSEGLSDVDDGDGNFYGYAGPWVSAGDSGFSSSLPFAISNTNHLAFLVQPGDVGLNVPFSPPVQVAIEDANNNILTNDNDTPITLLPGDLNSEALTGTSVVTTVNGVATFPGLADNESFDSQLIASTQGLVYDMSVPEVGGLTVSSKGFRLTGSGGGGGSGTGSVTPTISGKLAASGIAGQKLNASETLKLTASGAVGGSVTDTVYLDTGTTVDSNAIEIESGSRKIRLRNGGHISIPFRISSLPSTVAAGTYHVVVQVTDPNGNVTDAASGGTIAVSPPQIDLSGAFSRTPLPGKTGRTTLAFTVNNAGNVEAAGTLAFDIDSSIDGQLSDAVVLFNSDRRIAIRPGKSTRILDVATLPAGSYFLLVQLDPADSFNDVILNNNVFATSTQITLP
jgi:hypothetical protein